MKIVILGAEARYRAYQPAMPFIQQQELVFLDKDSTEAEILAAGADAEVLFVDAITVVSALGGNIIVKVKESRIAISQEMAQKIMV